MQVNENPNSAIYYFLVLIKIILKYYKLTVFGPIIVGLILIIVCLLWKNTFTSTSLVLPPQKDKSLLSSVISGNLMPESLLGLDGFSSNANLELAMALGISQIFKRKIISKFNLVEVYGFKRDNYKIENVIRKFDKNLTIIETDGDMFELSYSNKKPAMCSLVVRYAFDLLDSMYISLNREHLHKQQIFIQTKLEDTRRKLSKSIDTLIQFQLDSKMFLPDDQMEFLVKQIIELEIEQEILGGNLKYAEETFGKESSKYKSLNLEKEILSEKIESLNSGNFKHSKLLTSLKSAPQKIKNYKEFYSKVKILTEMEKYLTQKNEELKFNVSTNTPQLRIVSPGFKPQKKSGPPKMAITAVATGLSLVFFFFLAIIIEFFTNEITARSPIAKQLSEIKSLIFRAK